MLAAGVAACIVTTGPAYYSDVEPPPPQFERFDYRPGYVWIGGHWTSVGGSWSWQPGHYEPERPGYAYHAGGWQREGNRWHYFDGTWEAGNAPASDVIIRDHRGTPPPPPPPVDPNSPPPNIVVPSHEPPH